MTVAALAASPAKPAAWRAVPVPGGVGNLTRAAGLEVALPRWRALFELTRRLHPSYSEMAGSGRAQRDIAAYLDSIEPGLASPNSARDRASPSALQQESVPLPLPLEAWRKAVFRRSVAESGIVGAILRDRAASLLYRGLAQ